MVIGLVLGPSLIEAGEPSVVPGLSLLGMSVRGEDEIAIGKTGFARYSKPLIYVRV